MESTGRALRLHRRGRFCCRTPDAHGGSSGLRTAEYADGDPRPASGAHHSGGQSASPDLGRSWHGEMM